MMHKVVLLALVALISGASARQIAYFNGGPAPAPAPTLDPTSGTWGFLADAVGTVTVTNSWGTHGYNSIRHSDPDAASSHVFYKPLSAEDINAIGYSWQLNVNTFVEGVSTDETSAVLVEMPSRRFAVYFVPQNGGGVQLNCLHSSAIGHKVAGIVDDAAHTQFISLELRKGGSFGSSNKFEVWANFQGAGWSGVECDAEQVSIPVGSARVAFGAASLAGVGRADFNIFDFSVSDIPLTYNPVSSPMVEIEGRSGSIAWLEQGTDETIVALTPSSTAARTLDVLGRFQVLGVDILAKLDELDERLAGLGA